MLTLDEVLNDFASWEKMGTDIPLDVNSTSKDGVTPLHVMAYLGDIIGTTLLVQNGANINASDGLGNTALHEAALDCRTDLTKHLINLGALGTIKNKQGFTAMEVAINNKDKATIEALQNAS